MDVAFIHYDDDASSFLTSSALFAQNCHIIGLDECIAGNSSRLSVFSGLSMPVGCKLNAQPRSPRHMDGITYSNSPWQLMYWACIT